MNPHMSRVLYVGSATFFLTVIVSFVSKIILGNVGLALGLFILLLIISIGVIFDVIGTAITATKERPFNAMASKKVSGAKQALRLIKSADYVASFCNDIIGDITGTVSGATGAAIALNLIIAPTKGLISETAVGTIVIGFVAALTVSGKAWGKKFAISEPEKIILTVGKLLAWLEKSTGLVVMSDSKSMNRK